MRKTPVLEATGPERNSQLFSWNGADQYLIGDQDAVTAASDSVDLVSWVPFTTTATSVGGRVPAFGLP